MKNIKPVLILSVVCGVPFLNACSTPSRSGAVYSGQQTQREHIIRMAVVEAVRPVMIEEGQSGIGVLSGATVGGIAAGSAIGKGNGSIIAGVLGAVAGGLAGQAIEGQSGQKRGVEITVRLEGSNELRAIVQAADDEVLRPGDRVRLISSGNVTRVAR